MSTKYINNMFVDDDISSNDDDDDDKDGRDWIAEYSRRLEASKDVYGASYSLLEKLLISTCRKQTNTL